MGGDSKDAGEDADPLASSTVSHEAARYASVPVKSNTTETSALYARIELLQARCSALQEKLISQRTVSSNTQSSATTAGAGQRIPAWLPYVQQYFGPTAGQVAVLLFNSVDQVLRGLTQRLLNRDMWLWLFWAHLVVLYLFSGSCYLLASPDPNTPHKRINEFLDKTGVRSSPSAAAGQATTR